MAARVITSMPRPTGLPAAVNFNHSFRSARLLRTPIINSQSIRVRTLGTSSDQENRVPHGQRNHIAVAFFLVSATAVLGSLPTGDSHTEPNMSSKLIPPNPDEVMVIRDVTPNVVTFSLPFLRFGRFPIGGRGTVVRLTSGALAVFSPVALTAATKAKIASLGGDVRYLIATDIEHHIYLSDWAAAYPDAKLIGPEGLPEKRLKAAEHDAKIGKEPFAVVVTKENARDLKIGEDFDRDFGMEYVHVHPNKELVFCYKPEGVLIEADLVFNLPAVEQYSRVPEAERPKPGVLGRVFNSFQTTQGDALGMKRFLWHVASRGDRKGFNESVERIAAWEFDTIVPCHGETVVGGGREVFERVFAWHLEGKGASK